jgi:peptidoglycan/xylan/chitin deacetylase (PgdA/CDA1 family)
VIDDPRARSAARRRRQAQVRRRRLGAALGIIVLLVVGVVIAGTAGGSAGTPATTTAATTGDASDATTTAATTTVQAVAKPGPATLVFTGPTTDNRVALTFDDGFCESCIASIVKTLADTRTKATLFPNLIYADKWQPSLAAIRPLVASGQLDLGNHTWHHDDTRNMSAATFKTELERNDAWLQDAFGASSLPIFRPPFGTYNTTVVKRSGKLGYTTVVTWSGGSRDWEGLTASQIVRTVEGEAGPGVIYLLHPNYETTARALPRIIESLTAKGYRFVTLRELLGIT